LIKIEMNGFDEFTRRLERMARDVQATTTRLNRTVVDTPLAPDENGFVDRRCPSCSFLFKIAVDNPFGKVRACPSCGHRHPDACWETLAQLERATTNAREHATTVVRAAFSGVRPAGYAFGRRFAAASEGGVNVMRDGRWVVVGLPARASAALRSERTCAECGCRFSFIGSAFFCPGCGTSSADGNFAQSIAEIRRAIVYCRVLRETLPPDEAAIIERAVLEKAMARTW
jgi:NMD protein affecting ribosome stability and mRNA decay